MSEGTAKRRDARAIRAMMSALEGRLRAADGTSREWDGRYRLTHAARVSTKLLRGGLRLRAGDDERARKVSDGGLHLSHAGDRGDAGAEAADGSREASVGGVPERPRVHRRRRQTLDLSS